MTSAEPRRWLYAILAVGLSTGFISGVLAHGSPSTQKIIYGIAVWPLCLLTYAWMKADARTRCCAPPPGAIPLIPVLLPIAVPYYLLASRRGYRKVLVVFFFTGYIGIELVLLVIGESLGGLLVTSQGS
jgi:hypothetical protein